MSASQIPLEVEIAWLAQGTQTAAVALAGDRSGPEGPASVTLTEAKSASQQSLLATFQEAYDADLFGFTVTRIIGHYTYWTSDATDVSTTYNLSVGIRVDETSDTQGIDDTQQSDRLPINDPHVDWMYARNNLGITYGTTASATTDQTAIAANNRVELDLRAQRRMDELGQSLYLVGGLNDYPGEDVYVWYDFHVLCKRP